MRILITGSTDGIGFATAKMLLELGHEVIVHGLNDEKVKEAVASLQELTDLNVKGYSCDLRDRSQIDRFTEKVMNDYDSIDVLVNNAGVYVIKDEMTQSGFDVRFVVNTFAPFYLVKRFGEFISNQGRIVNLSSAAQAPVDLNKLANGGVLEAGQAYAQSKLALTMWGTYLGTRNKEENGPVIVSVNPKSFLGSQMVKDAYGMMGHDLNIGADIITRAATSKEFENAFGLYYNNDIESFGLPHPDARDMKKNEHIVMILEALMDTF